MSVAGTHTFTDIFTDTFIDTVNATFARLRAAGLDVTETTFSSERVGQSIAYTTTFSGAGDEGFHWLFEDFIG